MSGGAPATGYELRALGAGDGAAMLEVNRGCHISAGLALRFDREPDVFRWPATVFESFHYEGVFAAGHLVAYGMVGYRRGWLGDRYGSWGYVGDFRVLPAHRGRSLASRIGAVLARRAPPDVGLFAVLIPRGNRAAERVREAHGLPPGFVRAELGRLEVLTVPSWAPRPAAGGRPVEPLAGADCEPAAAFLGSAVAGRLLGSEIRPESLRPFTSGAAAGEARWGWVARDRGRVAGVLLATDPSSCRQVTVLRYGAASLPLRAAWRLGRLLRRDLAPLPAPGRPLRGLTVRLLAATAPGVARQLLAAAAACAVTAGLAVVHVGFADGDPLRRAVRGWPRAVFRSRLDALARPDALRTTLASLDRPPLVDLELA